MANALRLLDTSDSVHPMRDYDWTGSPPQWAIVRQINFKIIETDDGDEVVFHYSKHTPAQSVPTKADFETLLKKVCKPSYTFTGGPSELRHMLSLNSQERLMYVILKLAPRRWQFARRGRPLKIGEKGHLAGAYYDAHRVDVDGVADTGATQVRDNCKVAYFISDGPKAAGLRNYPHDFNIYVDLLFGSLHMPIALDPDVRHPGGSPE